MNLQLPPADEFERKAFAGLLKMLLQLVLMYRIFNGKIASMKCSEVAGDVLLVAHEKDERKQSELASELLERLGKALLRLICWNCFSTIFQLGTRPPVIFSNMETAKLSR